MQFRLQLTLISISFFFLFSSLQNSFAAHHLRVGSRSLSDGKRWIVLGVKSESDPRVPSLNFDRLGFTGPGMDHIDPKFLLEIEGNEIQRIRSFELQDYEEMATEEGTVDLPPTLLRLTHAKRSEIKHLIGNAFASVGKSMGFPIGTTTVLARIHSKTKENIYKLQAFYLLELLHKTLPDYNLFPEFRSMLSPDTEIADRMIRDAGSALLTRYHTESNFAGVVTRQNDHGDSFEKWRNYQAGIRAQNQGYLLRLANELGLHSVPIGPDFSFLFVGSDLNPDAIHAQRKDYPVFLNMKEMGDQLNKHQKSGESSTSHQLLPLSIISYIHSDGPIEVASFSNPLSIGQDIKKLAQLSIVKELSGSVIPFSNLLLNSIVHQARSIKLKNGDTRYLNHLQSYGALLALTETHAYKIHHVHRPLEVSEEKIKEAVNQIRIPHSIDFKHFSSTMNKVAYALGSEEEKTGRLSDAPSLNEMRRIKKTHYQNLESFFGIASSQSGKEGSRSPSSLPERKPVILFLIDGLRPDRFRIAAEEGLLPNLKALFIDRGVHLESYASRSLTVPSWSTILTGFENDVNGIRSNTPTSRLEQKTTDNFLDPMTDLLRLKYIRKSRSFFRLEEDKTGEEGKVWLPAYFHEDQRFYNFIPVVKKPHYAFADIFSKIPSQLNELINRTWYAPIALDTSSARVTAKAIREDKKEKLRFVMNWYASIDESQHYNNHLLPMVYQQIDQAIGEIIQAAKDHPVLKDATVFLMSDHGHSGGYGPFDETSTLYQSKHPVRTTVGGPLMVHTGFNLTHFFEGKFQDYKKYQFEVNASTNPHQPYYFDSFKGLGIAKAKEKSSRRKDVSALVDYAGDNLAHIYLKGLTDWERRHNFYELTHFVNKKGDSPLNLLDDLLNVQLDNLSVTHHRLAKKIIRATEKRPIGLIAIPLSGPEAMKSADRLVSSLDLFSSSREPVLVLAKGKGSQSFRYGLILTRTRPNGVDYFRYLVLKDFDQTPNGRIIGKNSGLPTLSTDPEDDPLEYLGNIPSNLSLNTWRTDREIISMTQNLPKPTAIFSLVRALTLSDKFTDLRPSQVPLDVKKRRLAEIPDLLVISNPGYAFHSDIPEESDHGGLSREEVRNSFFVSSLNSGRYSSHREIHSPPILTRDFMATILNYSGMGDGEREPLPTTQGMSFKSVIENR